MPVSNFRRRVGALSTIGLFAALIASTIVDPLGDNHDNAVQLHKATGHSSAVVASAALELVAAALAPVAVLWLVQLVRGRGARLANVSGGVGIAGSLGMAMIGVHQFFVAALADADPAHGVAVLDRLDHLVGPVPLLFFGVPVALVLLAVAVYRAGLAPRWVPALAVVFFVIDFLPVPGAEAIQLVLGLIVFGSISARALRARELQVELVTA